MNVSLAQPSHRREGLALSKGWVFGTSLGLEGWGRVCGGRGLGAGEGVGIWIGISFKINLIEENISNQILKSHIVTNKILNVVELGTL